MPPAWESSCYRLTLATVLLLFDSCLPAGRSRGGLTEQLAEAVAEGIRSTPGITLRYHRLDDASIEQLAQRLFP